MIDLAFLLAANQKPCLSHGSVLGASQQLEYLWEFPLLRILFFLSLYWGPPFLGKPLNPIYACIPLFLETTSKPSTSVRISQTSLKSFTIRWDIVRAKIWGTFCGVRIIYCSILVPTWGSPFCGNYHILPIQ